MAEGPAMVKLSAMTQAGPVHLVSVAVCLSMAGKEPRLFS